MDNVTAKLPETMTNATVVILDANGRTVQKKAGFDGDNIQLNTEELTKGSYVIRIADSGHKYTGRFMKL